MLCLTLRPVIVLECCRQPDVPQESPHLELITLKALSWQGVFMIVNNIAFVVWPLNSESLSRCSKAAEFYLSTWFGTFFENSTLLYIKREHATVCMLSLFILGRFLFEVSLVHTVLCRYIIGMLCVYRAEKWRKSCKYCDSISFKCVLTLAVSTQYAKFWYHSDEKLQSMDSWCFFNDSYCNCQLEFLKCTLLPKPLEPHSSAHSVSCNQAQTCLNRVQIQIHFCLITNQINQLVKGYNFLRYTVLCKSLRH